MHPGTGADIQERMQAISVASQHEVAGRVPLDIGRGAEDIRVTAEEVGEAWTPR
jgi:hypothetical protein